MTSSNLHGFRWRDFDAYLFDIDGTLLNSRDAVHYNAFHSAIQTLLRCDARIDHVPVHGNTDIGILEAVTRAGNVPQSELAAQRSAILKHMCEEVERNAGNLRPELCPAIGSILQDLHSAGKLMGIVSGNLEPIGWQKLNAAGIRHYFTIGSFSDRNDTRLEIFRWGAAEARKRLGASARVCFIGDTPSDISAARALNMPIVAVATGIYPFNELEKLSPDVCISCFEEFLTLNSPAASSSDSG
jgi:phosphoglycolate phosphatase